MILVKDKVFGRVHEIVFVLLVCLLTSPFFSDQINNSDDEVLAVEFLKNTQKSLEYFKGTQKRYNQSLQEAIDWGIINKDMQFDIWANQICYLSAGKKHSNYILTSAGSDGQFLTWDDLDAPVESVKHSLRYEKIMNSDNKFIKEIVASEVDAFKAEGIETKDFLTGTMSAPLAISYVEEVQKKLGSDKVLREKIKNYIIARRKAAMEKEKTAYAEFQLLYFSLNSRDYNVEKDAFLTDMLMDAGTAAKYIVKLQKGY